MAKIINAHTHLHPTELLEKGKRWGFETGTDEGGHYLRVGGYQIRGIGTGTPRLSTQIEDRVAHMDRNGIDIEVIQISPLFYLYGADASVGRECAEAANDGLARVAAMYPDRFWPAAHVPLQNVEMAVAELERAVGKLGMRAVCMGVNIGERTLDDPCFDPFYARVEALNVPVLVHPHPLGIDFPDVEWLKRHDVDWMWGYVLYECVAVVCLIFGGVLDRFPGIRFLITHGGGAIPYQIGRMEYQAQKRPVGRQLQRPVRDYLRQIYFDTCLHEPRALSYLIDVAGADQVVLGTNYPGWDHFPGWDVVKALPGLTDEEKSKILAGNAERLFGLAS